MEVDICIGPGISGAFDCVSGFYVRVARENPAVVQLLRVNFGKVQVSVMFFRVSIDQSSYDNSRLAIRFFFVSLACRYRNQWRHRWHLHLAGDIPCGSGQVSCAGVGHCSIEEQLILAGEMEIAYFSLQ